MMMLFLNARTGFFWGVSSRLSRMMYFFSSWNGLRVSILAVGSAMMIFPNLSARLIGMTVRIVLLVPAACGGLRGVLIIPGGGDLCSLFRLRSPILFFSIGSGFFSV
jgi:hypothetical protein